MYMLNAQLQFCHYNYECLFLLFPPEVTKKLLEINLKAFRKMVWFWSECVDASCPISRHLIWNELHLICVGGGGGACDACTWVKVVKLVFILKLGVTVWLSG